MTTDERRALIAQLQALEESTAAISPAAASAAEIPWWCAPWRPRAARRTAGPQMPLAGPPNAADRIALVAVVGHLLIDHVRRSGVSLELPGIGAGYILDMLAQLASPDGE